MIGCLPKQLNINNIERAIRSDFRVALLIFQAYNDLELSDQEKGIVMLDCIYEDFDSIPFEDYHEAQEKALWFLDGGGEPDENTNHQQAKKVMDWEQDEQLIFSAVNKVAGYETRSVEYLHWWTFLGYFNEIGEGLFSTVINIRQKKNKGKKLEKYEQEFYRENKKLIDIKVKLTPEEQAEKEYFEKLLG
ncbi:MAG: putative phage protein [Herbinix sp.]|jgi:hypothetical protein|nr:putative phage protein [Herbinix sp.]